MILVSNKIYHSSHQTCRCILHELKLFTLWFTVSEDENQLTIPPTNPNPSSVKSTQEVNWALKKSEMFPNYTEGRGKGSRRRHTNASPQICPRNSAECFWKIIFSFTWGCWQVCTAMAQNTGEPTEVLKTLAEKEIWNEFKFYKKKKHNKIRWKQRYKLKYAYSKQAFQFCTGNRHAVKARLCSKILSHYTIFQPLQARAHCNTISHIYPKVIQRKLTKAANVYMLVLRGRAEQLSVLTLGFASVLTAHHHSPACNKVPHQQSAFGLGFSLTR